MKIGIGIGLAYPSGHTMDPRSLFAAGEQGVWYEHADFATLYQDSAGTTPVTSVGQPVGLQLDKSRGLVLGPELVANGGFDSGIDGWLASGATLTHGSGVVRVVGGGADNYPSARQSFSVSPGKSYEIRGSARSVDGVAVARLLFRVGGYDVSTGQVPFAPVTGTTFVSFRAVWVATAETLYVRATIDSLAAASTRGVEFDNISVRELPGNHRFQATATARPLYQSGPHRLAFDGIDDVHNVNFPASLGSNCTIARAVPGVGASILTGQTIGTSLAITQSDAGLIIVNRPFTASETARVTAYLNARAFA